MNGNSVNMFMMTPGQQAAACQAAVALVKDCDMENGLDPNAVESECEGNEEHHLMSKHWYKKSQGILRAWDHEESMRLDASADFSLGTDLVPILFLRTWNHVVWAEFPRFHGCALMQELSSGFPCFRLRLNVPQWPHPGALSALGNVPGCPRPRRHRHFF